MDDGAREATSDPQHADPLGRPWLDAFLAEHGRPPSDADRQDRLFSLMFPGRGTDGAWTGDDWDGYREHRRALWLGERPWPVGDLPYGYDRFESHFRRLSAHYGAGRDPARSFTRATGLIWGGIAYEGSPFVALFRAGVGDHMLQLQEGPDGWRPEHVDDHNPVHHWVAAFVAGFAYGALFGALTNTVRDLAQLVTGQGGTMADIRLGNVAARHGALLRRATRGRPGKGEPYAGLLTRMGQDLRG